ncbi:hypothetical protein Scep_029019 [Stephania cephalantha]|uniref:DUF7894 domain-containing protein n=1 Tax=Stephania cephalantha TaxID=152367 RepID=A0AAP0HMC9_9MAGN
MSPSCATMKVAPKLIFLFKDPSGVGPAIFSALQQQPNNNNNLQPKETPFELSLDKYGIKDLRASGDLLHFIDHQGSYQVTVLLMENYEPPVVACAINQVLQSVILEDNSSSMPPTLLLPFVVQANSRFHWETNDTAVRLYATHIGPETDLLRSMLAASIKQPPPSLQIHYEPLACLIHFARVLNLPTLLLIGGPPQQARDKYIEHGKG